MSVHEHTTIDGGLISLRDLDRSRVAGAQWLLGEALQARSWTSFQQRTAHGTIEDAKRYHGDSWAQDALYRLQVDLVGQIGIALGELQGANTPSFGALLLQAFGAAERTTAGSLLVLLGCAHSESVPVEEAHLHDTILDLRHRGISPFPYHFSVREAARSLSVYSPGLDEDYQSLKEQALLTAASPIHATNEGRGMVERMLAPYPILRIPLRRFVAELRPAAEELFADYLAESYERVL